MGNQFTFHGFLPHKKGRNKIFTEIFDTDVIAVFYESPHRIMKTLSFIHENYLESGRTIFVARELTKLFEEKIQGNIEYVQQYFINNPDKIRGEFVVIVDRKNN